MMFRHDLNLFYKPLTKAIKALSFEQNIQALKRLTGRVYKRNFKFLEAHGAPCSSRDKIPLIYKTKTQQIRNSF